MLVVNWLLANKKAESVGKRPLLLGLIWKIKFIKTWSNIVNHYKIKNTLQKQYLKNETKANTNQCKQGRSLSNTGSKLRCPETVSSSCSICTPAVELRVI
jgi:hypothetical protein